MTALELMAIDKSFDRQAALKAVSLTVEAGEFLCILGPSNAGKTTLLKVIAGLLRPDSGRVIINGVDVTTAEPGARDISLLFQSVALFPDRTGYENIAFPLRRAALGEVEIRRRVLEVAELLQVTHLLDRLPQSYSGGEQQRVAIGRAIAKPSQLLLLDEPLSNLDARIRLDLRVEFRRLHRAIGQTILYVTHDQIEALSLGSRIAVLNHGTIEQVATPDDIYDHPANSFVADFVGMPPFNLLPVTLHAGQGNGIDLSGPGFQARGAAGDWRVDAISDGLLGVRPESILVGLHQDIATPLRAVLRWVEQQGPRQVLHLWLNDSAIKAVVAPDQAFLPDQIVWIGLPRTGLPLFHRTTGTSHGKMDLTHVQAL